ncbi:hypothetical protein KKA69_00900 [Patescibacteria group bacterium]|nr:hypothetical protein [Patescibacteria group bacterium]
MAKQVKISSQLPGVHDLRTQGNIPHPTTSPFVRLHQLQKTKERFLKELARLDRRLAQINKQVPAIERELERLFEVTEKEVRPSVAGKASSHSSPSSDRSETPEEKSNRTILEY